MRVVDTLSFAFSHTSEQQHTRRSFPPHTQQQRRRLSPTPHPTPPPPPQVDSSELAGMFGLTEDLYLERLVDILDIGTSMCEVKTHCH